MPVKVKAPARAYIAPTNWTGFYVGGFLGAAHGRTDIGFVGDPTAGNRPWVAGGLGGLEAGYNYQFANKWVVGVEGDIAATNMHGGRIRGLQRRAERHRCEHRHVHARPSIPSATRTTGGHRYRPRGLCLEPHPVLREGRRRDGRQHRPRSTVSMERPPVFRCSLRPACLRAPAPDQPGWRRQRRVLDALVHPRGLDRSASAPSSTSATTGRPRASTTSCRFDRHTALATDGTTLHDRQVVGQPGQGRRELQVRPRRSRRQVLSDANLLIITGGPTAARLLWRANACWLVSTSDARSYRRPRPIPLSRKVARP